MRTVHFIIFLGVFFLLYGLVNWYIFTRGWQAFPRQSSYRWHYAAVFLLVSLSFIFGRVLERITVCRASGLSVWVGSLWLAFMLYLFMGFLLADGFFLVNLFAGWFPPSSLVNGGAARRYAAVTVSSLAAVAVITGYIVGLFPRVVTMNLQAKVAEPVPERLRIAAVTDIHLGTIIGNSRLERMVSMINGLSPDIVLLGGDIVDEDLKPVIEQDLGKQLLKIKSRYGVYAVTGNHEYIGGVDSAVRYLESHGIRVLRDSSVKVAGSVYITGREDRSIRGFSGKRRRPLEEVLGGMDPGVPVILMDHQPLALQNAQKHGVFLQVSGHTHNGQLWPFNYVTRAIFEVSRGYRRAGGTHYYVSSGYGTWGPPVRLVDRPEIVLITVDFSR